MWAGLTDHFKVGFINSDSELYSPDVDRGVETRTFNITDELGTIQHVFSGKVIKIKKKLKNFEAPKIYSIRRKSEFIEIEDFPE